MQYRSMLSCLAVFACFSFSSVFASFHLLSFAVLILLLTMLPGALLRCCLNAAFSTKPFSNERDCFSQATAVLLAALLLRPRHHSSNYDSLPRCDSSSYFFPKAAIPPTMLPLGLQRCCFRSNIIVEAIFRLFLLTSTSFSKFELLGARSVSFPHSNRFLVPIDLSTPLPGFLPPFFLQSNHSSTLLHSCCSLYTTPAPQSVRFFLQTQVRRNGSMLPNDRARLESPLTQRRSVKAM